MMSAAEPLQISTQTSTMSTTDRLQITTPASTLSAAEPLQISTEASTMSAAEHVFGIAELLERILLMAPMREAFLAQRVSKDFRNTVLGSKMLQRRFFLLPCDKQPDEMLYGDGELEDLEAWVEYNYNDFGENPVFVPFPFLDAEEGWLIPDGPSHSTFADFLQLDEEGSYEESRHTYVMGGLVDCLRCSCNKPWTKARATLAPSKEVHSWRNMVVSQPATRPLKVTFYCEHGEAGKKEFEPDARWGENVDWMQKVFEEHQDDAAEEWQEDEE